MPYTPGSGTAWRNTVSNTRNLASTAFPDGVTREAWDLNFAWVAGTNGSTGTYTNDATGCRDFTTGPSGRFGITYSGVRGLPSCPSPEGRMPNFNTVVVTLSNGQTLTGTYASDNGEACGG